MSLNTSNQQEVPVITTAKNKNELIAGLKQQKDFAVLATHIGPAVAVAKGVAKYGSRVVSVTIIETKWVTTGLSG